MLSNALTLPHLLIIGVVVLVLFGRGKVSSLMGEVGKGITAFKHGVKDGEEHTYVFSIIAIAHMFLLLSWLSRRTSTGGWPGTVSVTTPSACPQLATPS